MSRPVGDVAARGVVEIGEATSTTVSGYVFTTVVALDPATPLAEWQDRGARVFAVRQDGRHYLKPLTSAPTASTGDLWLENVAGVTYLRYQGLQGLATTATSTTSGVTSVGLLAPTQFSVSGSPVTSTGSLTFAWVNQSANLILAGPATGSAAPTFRALVAADFPAGVIPVASLNTSGTPAASKFLDGTSTWSTAVTSVGLSAPAQFSTGAAVTGAGTLSLAWQTQSQGTFLAGPASGIPAVPTFRALVGADFPATTVPVGSISATGTPSSSTFLRGDGQWAAPAGTVTGTGTAGYLATWSSTTALGSSQYLPAGNFPALTGDVTSSNGALATTIASGAVSLAKMANLAANSLIGNNTGSAATPLALTSTQVKALLAIAAADVSGLAATATSTNAANLTGTAPVGILPVFTSSTAGIVPASGGSSSNYLSADGTWSAPAGSNYAVRYAISAA